MNINQIRSIGWLNCADGSINLTPVFENCHVQKINIPKSEFEKVRGDTEGMKRMAIWVINQKRGDYIHPPRIIPSNGGYNPINTLPIQTISCIVYCAKTLEILATAETHNSASEKEAELYRSGYFNAVPGEVRFYDEKITPHDLVGMKLFSFAHFIENNPTHPLIKQKLSDKEGM